jgi:hypothetical protein
MENLLFHLQGSYSEEEDSRLLENVGKYLPDYTAI